jgi:hypothetical protein
MAKVISIRKPALLPFPETTLQGGEHRLYAIKSVAATGMFFPQQLIVSEQCEPHVRVKIYDRTSGKFVSAELVSRLPLSGQLQAGGTFEIEVQCTRDCLFVGALSGVQDFEPDNLEK